MKNILIISVNYNSYDKLEIFLKSVHNSIDLLNKNLKCDINIVDNSTERKEFNACSFNIEGKLCVSVIESENFDSILFIYGIENLATSRDIILNK